eukprot:TRINITY_DN10751_c0_g1_i1.p1 TRINITY_DN10751_c0_g1~~TRINITY_DN10751_c0_g1_i1.p1  ORF type:complete len:1188 (+),score=324.74 TRINITY_DN10751_c0_g1_i1:124-3687(+)
MLPSVGRTPPSRGVLQAGQRPTPPSTGERGGSNPRTRPKGGARRGSRDDDVAFNAAVKALTARPVSAAVSGGVTDATMDFLLGPGGRVGDISHRGDRPATVPRPAPSELKEWGKSVDCPNSFLAAVLRASHQAGHGGKSREAGPSGKSPPPLPLPPSVIPKEFWVYDESPLSQTFAAETAEFDGGRKLWKQRVFPSDKPAGRTDVFLLARSLDEMLQGVDVSIINDAERCYAPDNNQYTMTFKRLLAVYNIGFAELIRQVYVACCERGVMLRRIWDLYMDFAQNSFDMVDHLKTRLKGCLEVEQHLQMQYSNAKNEAQAAKYEVLMRDKQIKSLSDKLEETAVKLKDQGVLEMREAVMKEFMQHQAERNRMLLQLEQAYRDRPATNAPEAARDKLSPLAETALGEERPTVSGDIVKARIPVDGATQTAEDKWDHALFQALQDFCKVVDVAVRATEEATPRYTHMIFKNPLESGDWLQVKLHAMREDAMTSPDVTLPLLEGLTRDEPAAPYATTGHDAGSEFIITKKMLAETIEDIAHTVREITARLGCLVEHRKASSGGASSENGREPKVWSVKELSPAAIAEPAEEAPALIPPGHDEVCSLCFRPPLEAGGAAGLPGKRDEARPPRTPRHQRDAGVQAGDGDTGEDESAAGAVAAAASQRTRDAAAASVSEVEVLKQRVKELEDNLQEAMDAAAKAPSTSAMAELEGKLRKSEMFVANAEEELKKSKRAIAAKQDEHSKLDSKLASLERDHSVLKVKATSTEHELNRTLAAMQALQAKAALKASVTSALIQTDIDTPAWRQIESAMRRGGKRGGSPPQSMFATEPGAPLPTYPTVGSGYDDTSGTEATLDMKGALCPEQLARLDTPDPYDPGDGRIEVWGAGLDAEPTAVAGGELLASLQAPPQATRTRKAPGRTPAHKTPMQLAQGKRARRTTELAAKAQSLQDLATKPFAPKPLPWILKQIPAYYRAKMVVDGYSQDGDMLAPLAEFVMDRIRQKHGTREMCDEQFGTLLATAAFYKQEDPRVALFAKFLLGTYCNEALAVCVRYLKAVDDAKIGPDYGCGQDDGHTAGVVSLVRCFFALGQMESCEETIESVTQQCNALAMVLDEDTFTEGMLRTGYAATDIPKIEQQWGCDARTARSAIRKIDFLGIIADHAQEVNAPAPLGAVPEVIDMDTPPPDGPEHVL